MDILEQIKRNIVLEIPIEDHTIYFKPMGDDTPYLRERGDGYGTFLRNLVLENKSPLIKAYYSKTLKTPNRITGVGYEKPIVWIVVPFQTNGSDGREEQRKEFLRRMTEVRETISDKVDLRIRFSRQVFSSYIRKYPHPLSERTYYRANKTFTPKFNRGAILNAAIKTITNGKVIITHDVDLVPESSVFYNAYSHDITDTEVLHLAGSWDRYNKESKIGSYLGGITGMTPEAWKNTNGYPNDYFGWGGEDDEFLRRVKDNEMTIIKEYYSKDRFSVEDLEGIETVETKRNIIATKDTDNLVKNELKKLYETGIKTGGLDDIQSHTVLIDYNAENEWVDTIDVVILPSAYTTLPKSIYEPITIEDARKDMYREALYRYKQHINMTTEWNTMKPTMNPKEQAYYEMRTPIQYYGGDKDDIPFIKRYRERLNVLPGYKNLLMDKVGSFSISYPETGKQMTNIMKMCLGETASVIDGTACLGGNLGYMSQIFTGKVIGIEINPFRAKILSHNIKNVYLKEKPRKVSHINNIVEVARGGIDGQVFIMDGDSKNILIPNVTDDTLKTCEPIVDGLFIDPPWGGPGYEHLPGKIGLEMTTRKDGVLTAADFLRPIVEETIRQRRLFGKTSGILSRLSHIFMKVPYNYDIDGLDETLRDIAHVYRPMLLIPDRTRKNRVFLVIIRIKHTLHEDEIPTDSS